MVKLLLSLILAASFIGTAKAGVDDPTLDIITNVFATSVATSSGTLPTVRVGVQNSKPSVVLNKPGYTPVVLANDAGSLSLTGGLALTSAQTVTGATVSVSTASTSTASLSLAGAAAALPSTGFGKYTLLVLTSDNALYISTETVVGTQSWVKVGGQ